MRLQVGGFCGGEFEEKIVGKALAVATDLLVQPPGRDAIELRKLGVEQHLMATQHEDRARDAFDRNDTCRGRARHRPMIRPAV